jgi:hypothetical protein
MDEAFSQIGHGLEAIIVVAGIVEASLGRQHLFFYRKVL